MNRKMLFSALLSAVLVSIVVVVPALQTRMDAVETTEESKAMFGERLPSFVEKLPESIRLRLTRIASIRSNSASKYAVEPQTDGGWDDNITVRRFEWVVLPVDKNFAPVKPKFEVGDGLSYVADSLYVIEYDIEIDEGTDPGLVTLVDAWKKGMSWGEGSDVSKPYYLADWGTNIPDAGPWNYDSKTGTFSVTFNPDAGPQTYGIGFLFLAKAGFINQFATKPKISYTLNPKTTPPLRVGEFYDMTLKMSQFKVKGLPLYLYVWLEVPQWQSTENGVYIKGMDPQIAQMGWWGADPPDVPGPEYGTGHWYYDNIWSIPLIDPSFPDHWIQVAFQKSAVTPAPDGNYLFDGEVRLLYTNKGFGIIVGDTPQLILTSADWNISVTIGLHQADVWSSLDYYCEEPKPTHW